MLKRTHQSHGVSHSRAPVVAGTLLALLPILALSCVVFLYPPLGFMDTGQNPTGLMTLRVEVKIFWPAIVAVTVFLLLINRSFGRKKARTASAGRPLPKRMPRAFFGTRLHGAAREFGEC